MRFFFLFFIVAPLFSEIHVIFTSALLSRDYDARKVEYLRSFAALQSYGFDPWIVEATHIHYSFYNSFSNRVFYPHRNIYRRNIGANEIHTVRSCFRSFPFQDEDVVVKLTGRYWLFKPTLFDVIRKNPDCDAYLKKWEGNGIFEFTGCFAMKWKHFKAMLEAADTNSMNAFSIAFEEVVAQYVKENHLKVMMLENFDILARINGIDETHVY